MDTTETGESRPLNQFAINGLKSLIRNVETGRVTMTGPFFVTGGLTGRGFVCRSESNPDMKMIVTWGFMDSSWRETPCSPPSDKAAQLEDTSHSLSVSDDEPI